MSRSRSRALATAVVIGSVLGLAGCAPAGRPSGSGDAATSPLERPTGSVAATSPGASPASETIGFAFSWEAVLAYYAGEGYACGEERPSTTAAGYTFRACQSEDEAGRTLVIGLVTDADGTLADAYASVQGTPDEEFLAPIDALDPLAGFLGVTLGKQRGADLLAWLAGHLGDAYAQTRVGELTVATYTASEQDHSTLFVEVGNQAYLDADAGP